MATRNEIFTQYKKEYWNASKKRKGAILDTVCEVAGMLRKSAIRKFRRLQLKGGTCQEGRGRPERYTPDVIAALKWTHRAPASRLSALASEETPGLGPGSVIMV